MSEYVITEKQDLINIANAIREKTETTDGMGLGEMAALIAAIEAGGASNIIIGEIVSSGENPIVIDLKEYGYVPGKLPVARFLFECDLPYTDTSHTKVRMLSSIHVIKEPTKENVDYSTGYYGVSMYQTSSSWNIKSEANNAVSMWDADANNVGTFAYCPIAGYIRSNNAKLYIGGESKTYGTLAGRKYMWGVIL